MTEFKITYHLGYSFKYKVHQKYYKFFGFVEEWKELDSFGSLEKAEEAITEYKKFPKYYECK